MSDQRRWFKLWASALDDPDLDALSLEDWARWAKLGTYIKVHGKGGSVTVSAPAGILCYHLKCVTFEGLLSVLQRLPNVTVTHVTFPIVTCTVTMDNWKQYQEDGSTARVRKHRAKKVQNVTHKKRREEKRINYSDDSPELRLSKELFAYMQTNTPGTHKPPDFQQWAKHVGLMILKDGRTEGEIREVIMWCQADSFWSSNILSTEKLRKQFAVLKTQMASPRKQVPKKVEPWAF